MSIDANFRYRVYEITRNIIQCVIEFDCIFKYGVRIYLFNNHVEYAAFNKCRYEVEFYLYRIIEYKFSSL